MSLLRKLNPFHRATPDEALVEWIAALENRREKEIVKWRKISSLGLPISKEWATARDLHKLTLILEAGVDIQKTMPARDGAKEPFSPRHFQERPLLDAMMSVSAQGAAQLISRGATITQSTVAILTNIAINYSNTHTNQLLNYGLLAAANPVFDYQHIALAMIKVEGLQWYGTYQREGSGKYRSISSMAALRQAFIDGRAGTPFQPALEEEQARRGWQVGHPPMSQWIALPGKPVVQHDADRFLVKTIESEEALRGDERLERIQELLDIGANPNAKARRGVRNEAPESLIGLTIMERDWLAMSKLARAGGCIDWEACDRTVAGWLKRYCTPRHHLDRHGKEFDKLTWQIGDLLKAVCQHDPIDWDRPLVVVRQNSIGLDPAQAKPWPATWGALMEHYGSEELRSEIEQLSLGAGTGGPSLTREHSRRRL